MRFLITGGAGFVGSHAAEYFAEEGNDVIVLDNLERGKILGRKINTEYNWNYLKKYKNIKLIKGDVRDAKLVKKLCNNVDVIVHAAAQVAVTTSLTNPKTDFEINALGTFNVLEGACRSGKKPKLIFCSTNKVYGNNVNKIPVLELEKRYEFKDKNFRNGVPENFPIDLTEHTPYGCSKLAGDIYVQDYAERGLIQAGVFRMSCAYGTRQFGVEDQGWVAWFCIATLTNKPITIYGDGKQVRDVLYVADLINAFDLFIQKTPEKNCAVYNIGGGPENTLSLLELLEELKQITGLKPKINYDAWRAGDQKVYLSDISKVAEELGWTPKIKPSEGIKNIVKWINENKDIFQ